MKVKTNGASKPSMKTIRRFIEHLDSRVLEASPNGLELKRSILILMFLRDSEPKPNGEAPGLAPTLAPQISKIAPSIANRDTHRPSSTVVPSRLQ